jgi:hypothetical protein
VRAHVLRRNVFIEAIVALLVARLAVRILSTSQIIAWASRKPHYIDRFAIESHIQAVLRAADEVGANPCIRAVCLPRALAAQAMLRRRGVGAQLCLGAARNAQGLAAHAWIELDRDIRQASDSDRAEYTRIVAFGSGLKP